jgi:hypothetical protein
MSPQRHCANPQPPIPNPIPTRANPSARASASAKITSAAQSFSHAPFGHAIHSFDGQQISFESQHVPSMSRLATGNHSNLLIAALVALLPPTSAATVAALPAGDAGAAFGCCSGGGDFSSLRFCDSSSVARICSASLRRQWRECGGKLEVLVKRALGRVFDARAVLKRPAVVAEVRKRKNDVLAGGAVGPLARSDVEAVEGEELGAVLRNERDGGDDVFKFGGAEEVVEVDADPSLGGGVRMYHTSAT